MMTILLTVAVSLNGLRGNTSSAQPPLSPGRSLVSLALPSLPEIVGQMLDEQIIDIDFVHRKVKRLTKRWKSRCLAKFRNKKRKELKKLLGTKISVDLDVSDMIKLYGTGPASNRIQSANSSVSVSAAVGALALAAPAAAPTTLDLRLKYPYCQSLRLIRDQSNCGCCFVFVAANAAADYYCIRKGINRSMSAQDVLECCAGCHYQSGAGCYGGYVHKALFYLKVVGVSTGELYQNFNSCKPYFMAPGSTEETRGPACARTCARTSSYRIPYTNDKYTIADYIAFRGEDAIISQLNSGGPVIITFDLFDDFFIYSQGIYQTVTNTKVDVHSARVIGYGVENEVKYWLCANSWGVDWGEEGFFRIVRGDPLYGIESYWAFAPVIN